MRAWVLLGLTCALGAGAAACSHEPRRIPLASPSPLVRTSPPPVSVIVAPPLVDPLTGIWTSPEWGVMRLTQRGTRVFGDYDWSGGQIDGEIVDGRLHFFWWEQVPLGQPYSQAPPAHRGDGYFDITPGSLDGSWRYETDFTNAAAFSASKWTARRTADLPPGYQYQPPPFGTPGAVALH